MSQLLLFSLRKCIPRLFDPLGDLHLMQDQASKHHSEKSLCNTTNHFFYFLKLNITWWNVDVLQDLLFNQVSRERERDSHTSAPPALPNLVTLPLQNEPLMSFIAASKAFCCKQKLVRLENNAKRADNKICMGAQNSQKQDNERNETPFLDPQTKIIALKLLLIKQDKTRQAKPLLKLRDSINK